MDTANRPYSKQRQYKYRETIGSKIRALEKGDQSKAQEVSQLTEAFRQNAEEYRKKRGVDLIIHGHTHRSLLRSKRNRHRYFS